MQLLDMFSIIKVTDNIVISSYKKSLFKFFFTKYHQPNHKTDFLQSPKFKCNPPFLPPLPLSSRRNFSFLMKMEGSGYENSHFTQDSSMHF